MAPRTSSRSSSARKNSAQSSASSAPTRAAASAVKPPVTQAPVPAPASPMPSEFEQYLKRAVAYHASSITMLWVLILFLSIGVGMVLLFLDVRLAEERSNRALLDQRVTAMARGIVKLSAQVEGMSPQVPTTEATGTSAAATTTVAVETPAVIPATSSSTSMSPTGTLDRGALSPDGTKFAGYDDVTSGKKGIGVEVIGETRVRHIVLFNTKVQSSGKGMSEEMTMSVRWTDNQTIEYDLLTLKNGTWVPSVETVKIFF